ncbi:MAG: hypothetical protein P4L69_16775 [Desulfosporosinus sp.]|nr:hypothetical protein [Desulfosporosinus sp.]
MKTHQGSHATEQDVPSAASAMDGIACGQNIPEVWCVSFANKRAVPELW